MNNLFIDLYEQQWDLEGIKPEKNHHKFAGDFFYEKTLKDLENEIHMLIGKEFGDGYYIVINSYTNRYFINIFIMQTLSNNNYLFLENHFDKNNNNISPHENISQYKASTYMAIDYVDGEELKELKNLLKKEEIRAETLAEEVRVFEKGASGLDYTILLEIPEMLSTISSVIQIGQFIVNKYSMRDKEVQVKNVDIRKLIENVSSLSGVNMQDLYFSNLEKEDGDSVILLTSRYKDFYIKCDNNSEIIEYNELKKSQTLL